jgi:hypothetical protein
MARGRGLVGGRGEGFRAMVLEQSTAVQRGHLSDRGKLVGWNIERHPIGSRSALDCRAFMSGELSQLAKI